MKFLSLIIFSCLATSAIAESFTTKIHSIDGGLMKFTNGRVAFLNKTVPMNASESPVRVVLDEDSNLVTLTELGQMKNFEENDFLSEENPEPFEPSIVPSMKEAQKIFNNFNPYYKRISECSDRAHVWAHDEFKRSGTKSMKAFVFFTASYINSVRFKWWFHVAPMFKVRDGGGTKDIVMDYRYSPRPQTVKEWTDQFVYTKRPCKVTDKFSEYDVNPQTENCYLMFESMHYRLPADLAAKEKNLFKNKSSEFEINSSFRFAFQKREDP
jgi:hypothetical protein